MPKEVCLKKPKSQKRSMRRLASCFRRDFQFRQTKNFCSASTWNPEEYSGRGWDWRQERNLSGLTKAWSWGGGGWKNGWLDDYSNSAKYCIQSDSSECEILCQKSLPCVSTPADFILVFRTLLNRLDCIILLNCYRQKSEIRSAKKKEKMSHDTVMRPEKIIVVL